MRSDRGNNSAKRAARPTLLFVAAPRALAKSLTLTADIVRSIVADAVSCGLDAEDLRARFAIPAEALTDVDARVPAEVLIRLWEGVPRLLNDDAFGLRFGERSAGKALPFAARIFEASRTVGDGLARLLRMQRVMNDVHRAELLLEGDVAAVRVRTKDSPLPVPAHAIDFIFAWMTMTVRRTTGTTTPATRVRFEHAAPGDAREHRRVFGCPVLFDAEYNELAFPRGVLDLEHPHADPSLVDILDAHARLLLERLPQKSSFASRVREALVPLLAEGPTIERVAEALRISERSVQRYLQDEGTTFAAALDDVRKRHAETALRDRTKSIAEVSSALGFADQSAFHRAFVRWTGTTPGAYRRASR